MNIIDRRSLIAGASLFNARKFWHAHEWWEAIWLKTSGPDKTFLQGLIQLAAAYHHVQRGTVRGALRLFDAAFAKLEPFPANHFGIDREEAVKVARRHRSCVERGERIKADEYPKLRRVKT